MTPLHGGAPRGRTWTVGGSLTVTSFSEGRLLAGGGLFADVALAERIAGVSFLQPSFRLLLATLPNTRTEAPRWTPRTEGLSLCVGCGPIFTMVKSAAVDLDARLRRRSGVPVNVAITARPMPLARAGRRASVRRV